MLSFVLARLTEDATSGLRALDEVDSPEPARRGTPFDPERVLREVAAKRAIVRAWLDGLRAAAAPARNRTDVPDAVVAEIAGTWSDHPEYDPAWSRPSSPARTAIPDGAPPSGRRPGDADTGAAVLPFRLRDHRRRH
jgi:hypothetical protein